MVAGDLSMRGQVVFEAPFAIRLGVLMSPLWDSQKIKAMELFDTVF